MSKKNNLSRGNNNRDSSFDLKNNKFEADNKNQSRNKVNNNFVIIDIDVATNLGK